MLRPVYRQNIQGFFFFLLTFSLQGNCFVYISSTAFETHASDAIFLLGFTQAVSGDWGRPPAAAVRWSSCGGHRLAGLHLHQEGSAASATLRREAQIPQHCACGAGRNICWEVKGNIYFSCTGSDISHLYQEQLLRSADQFYLWRSGPINDWNVYFGGIKLWISDGCVLCTSNINSLLQSRPQRTQPSRPVKH